MFCCSTWPSSCVYRFLLWQTLFSNKFCHNFTKLYRRWMSLVIAYYSIMLYFINYMLQTLLLYLLERERLSCGQNWSYDPCFFLLSFSLGILWFYICSCNASNIQHSNAPTVYMPQQFLFVVTSRSTSLLCRWSFILFQVSRIPPPFLPGWSLFSDK